MKARLPKNSKCSKQYKRQPTAAECQQSHIANLFFNTSLKRSKTCYPFCCCSPYKSGVDLPLAINTFLNNIELGEIPQNRQTSLLFYLLEFCRDYAYNVFSVMTLAAQMSSNISILIGPCLIRNVDDYWHNIFTCKGTEELCLSTYMLKNTGSKCACAT